jgi:hypothetical protein
MKALECVYHVPSPVRHTLDQLETARPAHANNSEPSAAIYALAAQTMLRELYH